MRLPCIQIGSAMLYAAAGFCVFLILLNRVLILMSDSRVKTPTILVSFILFVAPTAILGFIFARQPWVWAPLTVLAIVLLGEARRVLTRRSCAGSPPVETSPRKISITMPITTTDFVVRRYAVSLPRWQGAPLRIVHLTDLHVNAALPLEYYQAVLSAAEQTKADLAVFTGDFITSAEALPTLKMLLRPIARTENCAVLGNHDYWADPDAVSEALMESGLRLLQNESFRISIGENNIVLTGYDYPWGTRHKSVPSLGDGAVHIVLSHNPDNIYRLSKSRVDLAFTGHYHAGQIRLPAIGPIVLPSIYGRRFDHGHFVVNGTHLFVASGIGAANPPLRIYCQPDIFVVDIGAQTDSMPSSSINC